MSERTAEEMRAYLDNPPDYEDVLFHSEVAHWPETDQANMTEEAKRAYIEEHSQVCSFEGCGKTREWHGANWSEHQFELADA